MLLYNTFNLKAPLFKGGWGDPILSNNPHFHLPYKKATIPLNVLLYNTFNLKALLFKQGVFKVGGKLQNDFFKTLFHTAIAAFFRNFGLINIKNQPKH
jgi:hypothetical protein